MTDDRMAELFMHLRLTKPIFQSMFKVKKEALASVLNHYKITESELFELLWQEFDIPGMEVRIANTAFDFLIDRCEGCHEAEPSARAEIKHDILMSDIYYTNIAPNAINTERKKTKCQ